MTEPGCERSEGCYAGEHGLAEARSRVGVRASSVKNMVSSFSPSVRSGMGSTPTHHLYKLSYTLLAPQLEKIQSAAEFKACLRYDARFGFTFIHSFNVRRATERAEQGKASTERHRVFNERSSAKNPHVRPPDGWRWY